MVMTITNYTGTADTFTFPYNPNVYDDSSDSNHTITQIDYHRHHVLVSGGGIAPKTIILTGHMSGSSKETNFRALSKHFVQTTKLKKLYFESDKFALGVGLQVKKTHSGGRTNFIDYVATFQTIIGLLLDNTEETTGTNDGNVTTYVTSITGTVTSGASDITMTDGTVTLTIPAASLTTGQAIAYNLVKMVDSGSGILVSEYGYVSIAGVQTRTVAVTGGFGLLTLAAGANISAVSTTNMTTSVISYRDGWSQ